MLKIQGLQFGFEKAFFEPFDFDLHAGEVVALLGPNGTGKSTFMKVCSGELPCICGNVLLEGKLLNTMSAVERSQKIARVRPTLAVPSRMTVQEFVLLGRSAFAGFLDKRSANDLKIAEDSLKLVDAMKFAKRTLVSLSDGERARVFLAEALARESKVLLLDEPTAFLDVPHVISLFKLLRQVAVERKCGILICTHQVEYALRFSDRVIAFDNMQKKVFVGSCDFAVQCGALSWAEVK